MGLHRSLIRPKELDVPSRPNDTTSVIHSIGHYSVSLPHSTTLSTAVSSLTSRLLLLLFLPLVFFLSLIIVIPFSIELFLELVFVMIVF